MFRYAGAALLAAGALAGQAEAAKGDILVRGRIITVAPNDDSSGVNPAFPTGSVSVDEAYVPELDFTYMITDRIGAELILATSPHNISGEGALSGLGEIAETWVLPPTLTVQYHFNPEGRTRPYVGAGVNYTMFYNEETKASLNNAIGQTSLDLDDSVGWAVQAGFDHDINDRWFVNVDIKYINIETDATLTTPQTGAPALVNTVDVDINPIVAGVGFGMRF